MDPLVERTIDLPADSDEVWRTITDPEELAGWFAPVADLEVVPGGLGRFVDDGGVARRAVVDEVDPGRRLRFRWWPEGGEGSASVVTLVVAPRPGGSRLIVTERLLARASAAPAPVPEEIDTAWRWRFDLLWLRLQALVRV